MTLNRLLEIFSRPTTGILSLTKTDNVLSALILNRSCNLQLRGSKENAKAYFYALAHFKHVQRVFLKK